MQVSHDALHTHALLWYLQRSGLPYPAFYFSKIDYWHQIQNKDIILRRKIHGTENLINLQIHVEKPGFKHCFPLKKDLNVSAKELQYIVKPGLNFLIWVIKSLLPLFSCGSDFEFSLGSFSLLEEITSGQEWARFLTPNWASASADQRTLQEAKAPTCSTQSLFPNHSSNNQRGFHDRVAPPFSDVGATQTWPGYLQPGDLRPVSMDVSEEQMESMEHGHAQAGMRIGRQSSPPSFPQVARQFPLSQFTIHS